MPQALDNAEAAKRSANIEARVLDVGSPLPEEKPAHESTFALWFTRFMYFPAIGGNFVPLIQAVRIIINKSSENVSPIAWGFALFCLACWLTYGVVKHDKVLIWANVVGVINASILIACIVIYS